MSKEWISLLDILDCTVGIYDADGHLLTDEEIEAAELVLTVNDTAMTVTLAGPDAGPIYYVRLTPNFGTGMGSSAARIEILTATNVALAAPRWDVAGDPWDEFDAPGELAEPETGNWTYLEIPLLSDSSGACSVSFTAEAYFDLLATADFNCTCSGADGIQYRTLLEMRRSMIIKLGRGNQLANPGPGVAALIDEHLRDAQTLLYNRAQWLLMERWFSWPLLAGVRLYGLAQNSEPCDKRINPNKITWAGIVRTGLWIPMRYGIRPQFNSYPTVVGYPLWYEIRQCIEVWPAPDITEGALVIKGNFGLQPLVEDTDRASIDDTLICLLALGTLKAHFRQPDAQTYVQMGEVMLSNLVAGTHATERYIPGRDRDLNWIYVQPEPSVPFPP